MPSLNLKNMPLELHQRLKRRARQHDRSLNSEIIACLRAVVAPERLDAAALLARAQASRQQVAGHLTDESLASLKTEGRA
jgi:plasmid stability protein